MNHQLRVLLTRDYKYKGRQLGGTLCTFGTNQPKVVKCWHPTQQCTSNSISTRLKGYDPVDPTSENKNIEIRKKLCEKLTKDFVITVKNKMKAVFNSGSGYTAQDSFLNNISTVHQLIWQKLLKSDDLIIFMFHCMNNIRLATTYFVRILNCRGKARFFVAAFCSGHNIVKSGRGMDLLTIQTPKQNVVI